MEFKEQKMKYDPFKNFIELEEGEKEEDNPY